ncbi:MAG: hypothetical protein NC936_04380 [Candidatus Omnitrophica bacterium]|nr:hypothetical protein [Candidatus Omnitrophota bacterium]
MRKISGFALMAAIIILVLFATLGYVGINLFLSDVRIAQDTLKSTQALFLAEAGIKYLQENLSADDDWTDNTDFSKNMSGGNFSIQFLEKAPRKATIKSTGTKGDVSRKILLHLVNFKPFGYGLYVGGAIHEQNAKFFEKPDDEYIMEGATDFPEINFDYYESIADHKIYSNHTFTSGIYSGIWYIEGNVNFQDNVTINGSVIATGNIDMSHNEHITIDAYQSPYTGSRAKYGSSFWSQSGLSSYNGAYVNDGVIDVTCFSTASSSAGAYLKLDLGQDNTKEFVQLEFIFLNTSDYNDWSIEYSDNGSDWTGISISSQSKVPAGSSTSKRYRYTWDSVGAHRYWRLVKNTTGNGGTYAEVQFVAKLPEESPFSYPALVANGNFLFQDGTDINILGLIYCGADLSGNLLMQQTQYVNFVGIVIVTGNVNLQQSEYVSVIYQDQGQIEGVSGVGVLEWQETD